MANLNPPMSVTELLQLTHLGIPLEHITWPRVSMTSDNWICIRHTRKGRPGKEKNSLVTVLNPYRADFPQTWQTTAGSVKMNPWKPFIALKGVDLVLELKPNIEVVEMSSRQYEKVRDKSETKSRICTIVITCDVNPMYLWEIPTVTSEIAPSGSLFQVYDLESRQLHRKHRVPYSVIFWTWINARIIGLVTEAAVYHWDLSNGGAPIKVFYRHARLANAEVVNYLVDDSLRWHALSALNIDDNCRICGLIQLYSSDQNLSQPFEAHAVTFSKYKFQGNQSASTIMVVAVRGDGDTGKMHVIELGPYVEGNQAPLNLTETIKFEDQWEKYDFPVSVQVSSKFGLIYIMTKHGRIHLCDLETGVSLCSTVVSADIMFTAVLNSETHGIIAISRNGQVSFLGGREKRALGAIYERRGQKTTHSRAAE
uniref:Clathrin heavy chain linker core motif domain-containing protein n=1 Tax=Strigamia maritima TaxID=126957 RepID=T1J7J8_STRMM